MAEFSLTPACMSGTGRTGVTVGGAWGVAQLSPILEALGQCGEREGKASSYLAWSRGSGMSPD